MNRTVLPRGVAIALLAASLSAVLAAPSGASTAVRPVEPGDPPVVRDASITLDVDRTAMYYYRGSAGGAFTPQSALAVALAGCRGDNPAGTNSSPRTTLTVTGPDGSVVHTSTSPVRNTSTSGFLTSPTNQPVDAAPSSTNYRGDFPDAGAHHGMKATVDLADQPAGTYTVTTTNVNKVKTGFFGSCQTGTPVSNGAGGFTNAAPTTVPDVSTQTFEYRPWQHTFADVLGGGKVSLNTKPAELAFSIGSKRSGVLASPALQQQAYGLPSGSAFALPSDPAACAADLASCLPKLATECDPAAGCTPRLVVAGKEATDADPSTFKGVFDLETKAFVAVATVGGTTRTLMSVGTENDRLYQGVLEELSKAATAQGVDLRSILATEVSVGTGSDRASVSLLNGFQIDPDASRGGVTITTGSTAQAGIVLHLYSNLRLSGGACVANSASSANGDRRYAKKEATGYDVTTVDGLPSVPKVGALGAVAGGPVQLVRGTFAKDALLNSASAVVGTDTAAGEPNGYPVWVNPFLSGVHVTKPRTMEFLGTGTWSASESPVAGLGCLTVDLLLGTGVAVYDNPLSASLKSLTDPLTQANPATLQLAAAVDDAVEQVATRVTSDPTVSKLLTDLVGQLPLSGLPTP
ncbi:MAG: hypothetical protein EON53_14250 [Actinomycetales bacterium]|nr:MAG: hypothetical protein EON53_14250 [Actinomycetales bacterium]